MYVVTIKYKQSKDSYGEGEGKKTHTLPYIYDSLDTAKSVVDEIVEQARVFNKAAWIWKEHELLEIINSVEKCPWYVKPGPYSELFNQISVISPSGARHTLETVWLDKYDKTLISVKACPYKYEVRFDN
jgi:hypothetical protein